MLLTGFTAAWLASNTLAASIAPRQNNNTDYKIGNITLDTPWTDKVGINPWPEYPRPRLQRTLWKNLNGVWRYQMQRRATWILHHSGRDLKHRSWYHSASRVHFQALPVRVPTDAYTAGIRLHSMFRRIGLPEIESSSTLEQSTMKPRSLSTAEMLLGIEEGTLSSLSTSRHI
jgi:hypothetical protein